jgi:hypothetical protein
MSDCHRSTEITPTGTNLAGRSSSAGYRRYFAWRFI